MQRICAVVNEVLNTTGGHPSLDEKRCINRKQGRISCSACVKACAAPALRGRGEIVCADCLSCPRREHLKRLDETLLQVRRFLGDTEFDSRVILKKKGEGAAQAVGRRDIFGRFMSAMREGGMESGEGKGSTPSTILRMVLHSGQFA